MLYDQQKIIMLETWHKIKNSYTDMWWINEKDWSSHRVLDC